MLLLACFLYLVAFSWLPCEALDMGKAQINFKYATVCPEKIQDGWNFTIKTSKISRSKSEITFTINAEEVVDDKMKVDTTLAIWSNGGWKPNFYRFLVSNLCTTVNTHLKKAMIKLAKDSNFKPGCPIQPGPLAMNNFEIDMHDFVRQAVLPYAKLKTTSYILKGKRKLACVVSYVDIVPA